ncbi:uncharacterized protein LOC142327899 [Lycorma delicatula]|uniref:uncharacterized protein LOC142327899 n=1 Tax=Lycorma delicatula TaxID=130591 RepID=UPI003F511211
MSNEDYKNISKKKLRNILQDAYTFISNLERYCNFPTGDDEDGGDSSDRKESETGNNKQKQVGKQKSVLDVKKRLRGLNEIQAKLKEIKGKKMTNIQESRYKKNLKTRLKKQQKKEKKKLEKNMKKKNKLIKRDLDRNPTVKNVSSNNEENENKEKIVFNKEGKMVFNKFDFTGIGNEKNKKGLKKQEKDPKMLLEELKRRKSKLNELEQSGEKMKAKGLKEKEMWMSALKKSEGVKVKDDADLLKRTIRKQKEIKNRRKRKWDARVQAVEKKKEERQKKRQENISAKKKELKKKKIKHAVKKGRIVL